MIPFFPQEEEEEEEEEDEEDLEVSDQLCNSLYLIYIVAHHPSIYILIRLLLYWFC